MKIKAAKNTQTVQTAQTTQTTPESKTAAPEIKKRARRFSDDPSYGVKPAIPGELGPNGFPVGYNEHGDKVEWLPSDDEDREEFGPFFPMIIRRSDAAIQTECNDLTSKVWRHRVQRSPEGITNEFEWGLLCGRMSALSWVQGTNWDESLDT